MATLKSIDLSICVPCFNEATSIVATLEMILKVMKNRRQSYEILIVDDGSQDGTAEIVREYIKNHPECSMSLHQNEKNCGLGRNYFLTARRANGEYYVVVYGDNSLQASDFARILDHQGEADMIVPYIANQGEREWHRRFISECFNKIVSFFSGQRLRYYNGPVLHKRENVLRFAPKGSGFAYQAEILCRALDAGCSYVEAPLYYVKGRCNRSSIFRFRNMASVLKSLVQIIFHFLVNPKREKNPGTAGTERFEFEGYVVFNLNRVDPVLNIRRRLTSALQSIPGMEEARLENYHTFVGDDDRRHTEIQAALTEALRNEKWHFDIFKKNLEPFIQILGPDLDLEAEPYLRIVRPHKPQDNIGYHRDTIYGASPYELSVTIPFVNLNEESAICYEAGSHRKAESEIPFIRSEKNPDPNLTKGSVKHKLGFLYAPQILDENYSLDHLKPVPVRIGQIIIFSLTMLHGSVVNSADFTRWTCDARIKHAFAPVGELRVKRFLPLASSPAARSTRAYLRANEEKNPVTETVS